MRNSKDTITIDYYSDVLCVWAWIAQRRLDEIASEWGARVNVRHRFVDIFGDSATKIARSWGETDGYQKFAQHVVHSAAGFPAAAVNPDIWKSVKPRSSMPAHLMLRAAELVAGQAAMEKLALATRQAFFRDARDIAQRATLLSLAEEAGVDSTAIESSLEDGSAFASLSKDLRSAADASVRGSPTWVLNGGRQILYGNVGYRIIGANIEELLRNPAQEASWC